MHILWPTARPVGFAERCFLEYIESRRSTMVTQSILYSASLHLDALAIIHGATGHVFQRTEQLRLKGLVMNQILDNLSHSNEPDISDEWADDMLMSILYLAANENLDKVTPLEKGPFSPPFRELQLMEFYGSCDYHPLHWQTVQRIVLNRGGLHVVKLYGLAWLISM